MSDAVQILPVRVEMAQAMAGHHALSFAEAWSTDSLTRMLAIPGTFGYVAVDSEDMVGFVLARALGGEAEILTVAVDPTRRRKSIGRVMLSEVIAEARTRGAREMFLEVAQDNLAALALYESSGFLHMGRRIGYYREGGRTIDALTLRRSL